MTDHRRNTLIFGAAILSISASSAFAESDSPDVSDIIVTAQKKEETLQTVPLSVSALDPARLAASGQIRLEDYFSSVPGLSLMASSGYTAISIRGLSTSQLSNPVVGIVIDDIPFGGSTSVAYASRLVPDIDPADLARIEVLRGPQGTLYGASGLGGLLKYVTVSPSTDRISARAQAGLSVVDGGEVGYELRGSINVPLSEQFAVRASAFVRRDPGYVDNLTTGESNVNSAIVKGGRLAALWKPADNVSLKVAAILQKVNRHNLSEIGTDDKWKPTRGISTERMINTGQSEIEVQLYSAALNVDLGGVDLASITGYGISSYRGFHDQSRNRGAAANTFFGKSGAFGDYIFETKRFTQEVRLSSSKSSLLDWVIGGFYSKEKTQAVQNFYAADPADGRPAGTILSYVFPSDVEEFAIFGDATFKFTEQFDLQLGGRYASNNQNYRETDSGAQFPTPVNLVGKSKNDAFTYVISPRWRITPEHMVYGRVSTGYRVGGPNPGAILGFPTEFGSDETINFEVGYKGSLLNKAITYDFALFHTTWKDIQLTIIDPVQLIVYTANGPKAKSKGAEFSIRARPTRYLNIEANAGYSDAALAETVSTGAVYGGKGDQLPYSAKFTGSLSIDQDIPVSDKATMFVGGTLSYVGTRYGEFTRNAATPKTRFPDYVTLNLRAGLNQDNWSLNAFVTNVTNERGVLFGGTTGSVVTTGSIFAANFTRPRTFGLSFTLNH